MLDQSISISELIEVLRLIQERDGLETVTLFELLHVLPSETAAHPRAQWPDGPGFLQSDIIDKTKGE